MLIPGYSWLFVVINLLVVICGYLYIVVTHGYLWLFVVTHGYTWLFVVIRVLSLRSLYQYLDKGQMNRNFYFY